jgi:hypothetical protein
MKFVGSDGTTSTTSTTSSIWGGRGGGPSGCVSAGGWTWWTSPPSSALGTLESVAADRAARERAASAPGRREPRRLVYSRFAAPGVTCDDADRNGLLVRRFAGGSG